MTCQEIGRIISAMTNDIDLQAMIDAGSELARKFHVIGDHDRALEWEADVEALRMDGPIGWYRHHLATTDW